MLVSRVKRAQELWPWSCLLSWGQPVIMQNMGRGLLAGG